MFFARFKGVTLFLIIITGGVNVHLSADNHWGQKYLMLIELEIQMVVSCPMWVVGTKLGSSVRVILVLNCWGSFQPPLCQLKNKPPLVSVWAHTYVMVHMWKPEDKVREWFSPSTMPREYQRANSCHQACQQAPLPNEPNHQALTFF